MPDIAMCNNRYCPSRETCYRHIAAPSEFRQSYARFKFVMGKGRCNHYIEAKAKSQIKGIDSQTKEVA